MDFDSIYEKYYNELYAFTLKQNQLHIEAADLLQDVFAAFYKQLNSGSTLENPRAWLYKVLLNSIRSEYKINQTRIKKNNEITSFTEFSTDSSIDFYSTERRRIVENCISQLPANERNLLLLYHKGFSYREISEILNIGYTSVGTCIARATQKLKSILIAQYHELFE